MKILITGNKGYIGSVLTEMLEKQGNRVYGIDIKDGKDILTCNLDYSVDLVIHLAAESGVRKSLRNPSKYWYVNVDGTRRILEHFKDTRVIYASSSSAYEPHLNPYAASKMLCDEIAKSHSNSLGLRLHTVYNSKPRPGMLFDLLLNNKLEYVTHHYRDFIHMDDVMQAFNIILDNPALKGVIDVGTGQSVSIEEICPKVPVRLNTPHERIKTCADIKELAHLGFKPKHTVENFLKKSVVELDNYRKD